MIAPRHLEHVDEIAALCEQNGLKYGKGTIQKEVNLNSGSSYKYTTDRWLTSKGKWLNRGTTGGIDPDIDIEKYGLNDLNNTDLQLQKAISILNEKNS